MAAEQEGQVALCIIGVLMVSHFMSTHDTVDWTRVQREEDRPQH